MKTTDCTYYTTLELRNIENICDKVGSHVKITNKLRSSGRSERDREKEKEKERRSPAFMRYNMLKTIKDCPQINKQFMLH